MGLPIFVQVILNFLLDYLSQHSEEIIAALKAEFPVLKDDPIVQGAIQELGYSPTEEALTKLHDLVKEKGEDPAKIAKVLINNAEVA